MIKFLDLKKINEVHAEALIAAARRVIESGWYVLGNEVASFEQRFAEYLGVKHVVGVASGLDALKIILRAYKELNQFRDGDEVIVPANTYIATILAIISEGLKPVLVEPDIDTYNIDANSLARHVTDRTKAVMIVHLYGQSAYNDSIFRVCERHNLMLLEDAAQAAGAVHIDRKVGALGHAAGFSFYPGKNLGALGDGGAICTDSTDIATVCRALSNYGSQKKYYNRYQGYNSRLDEIQAAFLLEKLPSLDGENQKRREIASYYLENIANDALTLPKEAMPERPLNHVWHLFVIRTQYRDQLIKHLESCDVQTMIHYPVSPNHQEGYPELGEYKLPITERIHREVLSLPIGPVMTNAQVQKVVGALNEFEPR